MGKGTEKKILASIRVLGIAPRDQSDWQHVLNYALHLKNLRVLLTRWSALAEELKLPVIPAVPARFP